MTNPRTRWRWLACVILALVTVGTFWPVTHHDFITYDDTEYITENTHLSQGITIESIRWAFATGYAANWHPLTWLSHMLDVQLFGLNPGLHHLTNLLFHVTSTILLFLLLERTTKALWPSAVVSALFAVHPMHVESVAWASERKDVLSAFFFMLTVLVYTFYAQPAHEKADVRKPKLRIIYYFLALCFFALGLMSKSMLVTLPFLMLLLDFWPLKRLDLSLGPQAVPGSSQPVNGARKRPSIWRLCLEKVPFFVLSAISCAITLFVQRRAGAMMPVKSLPIMSRVENAIIAYLRYLGKALWPSNLILPYPPRVVWPIWQVAGAFLILLAITSAVVLMTRRRPYLPVGWFWFLGMLVPVIGLLQVGAQSMADRYFYLPSIGFFIMLVWTLLESPLIMPQRLVQTLAIVAVAVCALLSRIQLAYWQNSVTLFSRAIAVSPGNYVARTSLGIALMSQRRLDEAAAQFQYILSSQPEDPDANFNLAIILNVEGRPREAVARYRRGLRSNPNSAEALNNLAWLLATSSQADVRDGSEAVKLAQRACELTHDQNPLMLGTLAAAYAEVGRFSDAIRCGEKAKSIAEQAHDDALAATNEKLLQLYRSGKPARDRNSY